MPMILKVFMTQKVCKGELSLLNYYVKNLEFLRKIFVKCFALLFANVSLIIIDEMIVAG